MSLWHFVAGIFAWMLRREYPDWAPRVATRIVAIAAFWLPEPRRTRMRAEWEAELYAAHDRPHGAEGLVYAVFLLRYAGMGLVRLVDPLFLTAVLALMLTILPPSLDALVIAVGLVLGFTALDLLSAIIPSKHPAPGPLRPGRLQQVLSLAFVGLLFAHGVRRGHILGVTLLVSFLVIRFWALDRYPRMGDALDRWTLTWGQLLPARGKRGS